MCYNGVMGAENMDRRKRINRLKKCVIAVALIFLLLPIALCLFMTYRMGKLERQIQELTEEVQLLSRTSAETVYVVSGEGETISGAGAPEIESTGKSEAESGILQKEGVRRVYLTFDDGPSSNTSEILEVLDKYEVKATFFVVGKEDEAAKQMLSEIAKAGHSIGMHSYSHKYGEIYGSKEAFLEDYQRIHDYIEEYAGIDSRIYRFPGGTSNSVSNIPMGEFVDLLEEDGVFVFDWNISSKDAGGTALSAQQIVKNCLEGIESKENVIILMHDAAQKDTTVEALPMIIENIMALPDTVILPITQETEPVLHIQR